MKESDYGAKDLTESKIVCADRAVDRSMEPVDQDACSGCIFDGFLIWLWVHFWSEFRSVDFFFKNSLTIYRGVFFLCIASCNWLFNKISLPVCLEDASNYRTSLNLCSRFFLFFLSVQVAKSLVWVSPNTNGAPSRAKGMVMYDEWTRVSHDATNQKSVMIHRLYNTHS